MLDDYARQALIAVPPDVLGSDVEAWFQFVAENVADESGSSRTWDDFAEALKNSPEAGSFSQAVDVFTEEMAQYSSEWPGIADQLAQESTAELAAAYAEALAEPAAAEQQSPGELWAQLVADGGDWSAWDGSEAGWAQWRDWFYNVAATRAGAEGEALARQQIGPMDAFPLPQRIAGLEQQGFTVGPAARAAAQAPVKRDPGEVWAELVAEGGDWSAWDGSEAGWAQWRDWFYNVAATRAGADGEALARQQIGGLEGSPLAERVIGLQQQGFTVTGAAAALEATQQQALATVDGLVTEDIDGIIDGALAAVNIDSALAEGIKPLVRERLEATAAAQPELFAGLGAEELDNLRNQLQQELVDELQSVVTPAA
ncbi:hypothetical protein [Labedaea rhizosphaerae]|uniref:Uncharacterized protein n=1 Tax=Labedaea rhizosphaerae TaxID=598644 RepID=A0A4R6S8H2_LABRH|nr:hypothetical protein [Labedaea rhizosphaerae]TDP95145.1 hypothetical protein EV186_105377 [Labedaea rhizosphaerae]